MKAEEIKGLLITEDQELFSERHKIAYITEQDKAILDSEIDDLIHRVGMWDKREELIEIETSIFRSKNWLDHHKGKGLSFAFQKMLKEGRNKRLLLLGLKVPKQVRKARTSKPKGRTTASKNLFG